MSKSFKNKLISGLLTLAMVFSMVPTNIFTAPIEVQAAEKSISDIPNVKMSFVQVDETTGQSDYKEDRLQAVQKDTGIDGLKLVAGGVKSGFTVSLWHYSGGYWGNNYKPIIYDTKLTNPGIGGIGGLEDAVKLSAQTFSFNVYEGSGIYKAIENGEELVINLTPTESQKKAGIKLENLFALETTYEGENKVIVKDKNGNVSGMKCTLEGPKKIDGKNAYTFKFTMDVKLNYWGYKDINFNATYDLNLTKHAPFIKNGYGYTMFAMWTPAGKEIGAAPMWYNENDPWSLTGLPKGYIHPTMIRPHAKTDIFGMYTSSNHGGLLYEKSPLFKSINSSGVNESELKTQKGTWSFARAKAKLLEKDANGKIKTFDVTKDGIRINAQTAYAQSYFNVPKWAYVYPAPTFANIGYGTFASAGAVGLFFDFGVDLDIYVKEKTKIVASYVAITGFEGDSPIYETVMESKLVEDVNVNNYIAEIQHNTVIEDKDGSTYLGILNDVVTSPKDLGEAKDVDWSKNLTPETATNKIEANSKDIDYYKLGIVTDSSQAIYEAMMNQSLKDSTTVENNYSGRSTLLEKVSDFTDKITVSNKKAYSASIENVKGEYEYGMQHREHSAYWQKRTDDLARQYPELYNSAVKTVGTNSTTYKSTATTTTVPTVQERVDSAATNLNKNNNTSSGTTTGGGKPTAPVESKTNYGNLYTATTDTTIKENDGFMAKADTNPEDFGRINYNYFENIFTKVLMKVLKKNIPDGETSEAGDVATGDTTVYVYQVGGVIDYSVELDDPTNVPTTSIPSIPIASETEFEFENDARNVALAMAVGMVKADNALMRHAAFQESSDLGIDFDDENSIMSISDSIYRVDSNILEFASIPTENVIYLRYIVYPDVVQKNKINIIEDGVTKSIITFQQPVTTIEDNGTTVDVLFNDITAALEEISDVGVIELEKWVTSDDNVPIEELKTRDLPPADSHQGTDIPEIIENVPIIEDIYAEWNIIISTTAEYGNVPEWRLSKLDEDGFDNPKLAGMSLPLKSDIGCYASSSYLTPSGTYNYWLLNPNETRENGVNKNYKVIEWLHSQAFDYGGSYSVTHDQPWVEMAVNAKTNLIKATKDSNHILANWLETEDLYSYYDIQSGSKPLGNISSKTYTHSSTEPGAMVDVGLENKDTYTHRYGYKTYHYYYDCGGKNCSGNHLAHDCCLKSETPSPQYTDAVFDLTATFNRYKIGGNNTLIVNKDIQEKNGLTTIKYQLKDTALTVYPEYGMLFEKDNADESIRWVIGDTARVINPVVWQTLEHKVWVKPTSTGTSVANDSRGITKANSIGEAGKQIIYKGAGVNTNFRLYQSKDSNKVAMLTVKTYALDFKNDSNYSKFNGASGWNNGYKSYDEHNALLSNFQTGENAKATVTEKLLVDIPYGGTTTEFEGATKTVKSNPYKLVKYQNSGNIKVVDGSNGAAVVFEHELVVRGGYLIGVRMDKHNGSKELLSIDNLKAKAENNPFSDYASFYNALIGMNLYDKDNKKDNTVFKGFLHKPEDSQTLNEGVYATKLEGARTKNYPSLSTPSYAKINDGDKWYSEDTTVLVVREYVSNFEVPSISISDKLPMTISGTNELNTPANKNEFFSKMGKGYLYLNYTLNLPISNKANLGKNVNATFTYTSFPTDLIDTQNYSKTGDNTGLDNTRKFGEQATNYLVPNVSITDTTRLN